MEKRIISLINPDAVISEPGARVAIGQLKLLSPGKQIEHLKKRGWKLQQCVDPMCSASRWIPPTPVWFLVSNPVTLDRALELTVVAERVTGKSLLVKENHENIKSRFFKS